jgi:hypothetical protein
MVAITNRAGDRFVTTVSASSSHEAVREAINLFSDPFWKGPKPTPEMVYEVTAMGRSGKVLVRGSAVGPTR